MDVNSISNVYESALMALVRENHRSLNIRFNNSMTIKSRHKLCHVCLTLIDVRYIEMKDHVDLCRSRNEKQHIRFPIEGQNFEKFKNFKLMNKLQFYVSADTECSVVPIKEPDSSFLTDKYPVNGRKFRTDYMR